jgi:hypothetical protein
MTTWSSLNLPAGMGHAAGEPQYGITLVLTEQVTSSTTSISLNVSWIKNDNADATDGVVGQFQRNGRFYIDSTIIPVANYTRFDWSENPSVIFTLPSTLSPGEHYITYYAFDSDSTAQALTAPANPAAFHSFIYKTFTVTAPPLTPLYLGKAMVNSSGNMDLLDSIVKTNKVPVDPHQLVPKAYVDKYNSDILAYLAKVLDGNGLNDLLTRLSLVEEQLDRSYKAIWNLPRNTDVIRTEQNPSLTITGNVQNTINASMIANPPTAPATGTDLGSGFSV